MFHCVVYLGAQPVYCNVSLFRISRYTTGVFLPDAPYGEGVGPIWLDTVLCTNADYNVGNCAHDPWGVHDCNHFEDVSIACG